MIWYPYQQMKTMQPPIKIRRAEGVYLYPEDGSRLIDAVSSWWSTIHGYHNPVLDNAIRTQLDSFAHVMLGGLTHEPAERLSAKLQEWLPGDLNHCFFSDSGSVAVEVALKMALQYFMNQGDTQRTMVLALEHAYHGDTFKTMEVGDDEDYHFVLNAYGKSKYVVHIPTEIDALEQAFAAYHDQLNCMIVEPLLQGAGGMRMYDVSFLKRARQLCDQYGVLLIFDEVATGFGRTGNRFVADLVLPDILVLGKALTGGYIGHAVTVANEKVYQGFYSDDPAHALMHGPTFMGNALACSVALKSIALFEDQNYLEKIKKIESVTCRELSGFTDPRIKEVRIMGGCSCIEVLDEKTLEGFKEFAYERGVFLRPFLRYLYTMVPYVMEEDELVQVLQVMKDWFRR
ncbi:MAG: adenosylmethionine--8-amino-7-oxononanoate transaminase [Oscillibacter ruminantium]|uniref:adenosylmethionine--8-amino-7-oxononanoate transaminase n=1 Tax=Oscillibacter ruminantium TaxID=1263547 RepID=UPI002B217A57|nr:adenosylmethionine--8-amino-7-oxononanoate transaminase [Oscillibacter ruminantium]MEA5041991.1 adenosylmethionine--8-amino-7-oxononanoate transaminase [Oscillibacter ruminantium]